jgi:K(+)-stimulated pyrophosphate-energized sodium pump
MKTRMRLLALLICLGACALGGAALAADATPPAATTPAAETTTTAASAAVGGYGSVFAWLLWIFGPLGAIAALFFAWRFYQDITEREEGTEQMRTIAGHVRDGANAYLNQQYRVVGIVVALLFVLFLVMAFGLETQSGWMPFAFLAGAIFSGLCGFFGMRTATNASARTAHAARTSLNGALRVSFRAGAVMGLVVVGFALLNICVWFLLMYLFGDTSTALKLNALAVALLSSGMGASTQALFARVGGGIFTKAADVGADLVGKVEAGIPEDDPRNPATIADNVGDNVGDVAGMGADLFESYANSILAAGVLGVAAAIAAFGQSEAIAQSVGLRLLMLPVALAGFGCIASIIGVHAVSTREDATQKTLIAALMRGELTSAGVFVLLSLLATVVMFIGVDAIPTWQMWGIWAAVVVGLVVGFAIGKGTEYYTSADFSPTQNLANEAKTGPATVIIGGLASGMVSTWLPVVAVVLGVVLSFAFAGGFTQGIAFGLYGVGIAAVGMLSTLGMMLATDAYGPIADNAGGNAEMAELGPEVRERTDALDSLGNTTAAVGKGFAIGSAALTALALIAALLIGVRDGLERRAIAATAGEELTVATGIDDDGTPYEWEVLTVQVDGRTRIALDDTRTNPQDKSDYDMLLAEASLSDFVHIYDITLINPKVLSGMFIGAMLAFLFCSFTMKAVGRAAADMVEEVRRQFRELGILEGKGDPDYASCVAISTKGAQRAMLLPSLLAIVAPVLVGLLLGVGGLAGMLVAALTTGFVLAVMMANAGGAWDNAKKWIETGELGGKGSDCHKAAVVGDTVGDPFKDTSGPSLNILIKLMSMVAVVFAGLIVKMSPYILAFLRMD